MMAPGNHKQMIMLHYPPSGTGEWHHASPKYALYFILSFSRGFIWFLCLLFTATLGAVFGLTTCLSAQIREKPEDPLNYFIGGCVTGVVLGARGNACNEMSPLFSETFVLGKIVK